MVSVQIWRGDLRKRSGICGEWLRRKYGGAICESGQGAAADGAGDEIGLGRDKGLKQW